jgi:hypothetical protein
LSDVFVAGLRCEYAPLMLCLPLTLILTMIEKMIDIAICLKVAVTYYFYSLTTKELSLASCLLHKGLSKQVGEQAFNFFWE